MQINKEDKTKLLKKIKWVSALLIVILTIVLGVSIHMYYQIEPLAAARLKETVRTSTNNLYSISFSRLSINPFTGSVTIKNIVFKANHKVYERFKRNKINPSHLYEIKVKTLKLRRVHPLKVYLKRDLDINSMLVEKPIVRVYYEKTIEKDSSKVDVRTAWQRLSKYLNSVRIEEVLFKEIDFKYIDRRLSKPEINSVKNLSITVKDILIDSLSHLDQSRFYHTKDILVEVFDNQFTSDDDMYTIKFDKLEMSTQQKYAMVKGLKVIPKYPEIEFSLKWNFRKARYSLNMNEIWLKGIDYKNLTDNRKLHASSLHLKAANLEVFMNKQRPRLTDDLGSNFPQSMLNRLRLTSTIDSVKIEHSGLSYVEYNPHTQKKGKIEFTALSGELLNLTNDTLSLTRNNWAKGRFTSFFYGKGRLDFNMNFNLTSPVMEYSYSGKLHKMQARYFNQITRPLALLDISSGEAQSANFSVKANYRRAQGSMTLIYNDLNIGILKLNQNKRLQRSTLLSLVANNLLLKEDNPSKGESIRTGKIRYYRPDSVSFYGMIWKSMFSGIKESIGMTQEREKNLQQQFESFKNENASDKQKRKLNRQERRRRRASKR